MAYQVRLTRVAEKDAYSAYEFIRSDDPEAADKWLLSLFEAILSLEQFPHRCLVIPEARILGSHLRQLLHGRYRIVFEIVEHDEADPQVLVLRIWHGMRNKLRDSDISDRTLYADSGE
jgi:plasmid stabilization system protein ParE